MINSQEKHLLRKLCWYALWRHVLWRKCKHDDELWHNTIWHSSWRVISLWRYLMTNFMWHVYHVTMTLYFNTTESQTGNLIHKVNITMVMSTSINKRHHFLRYILMSVNILMLSVHIGEFSMYKITAYPRFLQKYLNTVS